MKQLINPKTDSYNEAKEFILGAFFPWYWNAHFVYKTHDDAVALDYYREGKGGQDVPFLTHAFLNRPKPGEMHPTVNSKYASGFRNVLNEIFDYNNIDVKLIYRMNANLMQAVVGYTRTFSHVDHPFPHKNLIIYLTNVGGDTVCGKERHRPQEDDIITFEGVHYNMLPKKGRRIVLVATYL